MYLLNQFWAPRKVYNPCGMFTYGHIVLLLIAMLILSILLLNSRKITKSQIKNLTKVLSVFITILEAIKIYFNFYHGYTWINAWFPMSYCSLFIYALWLSGYGKGTYKKMGEVFIAGVAIVASGTYLLIPSTSLTMYPMWHYLCMYSMLFHTLMVYMGILYLWKKEIKLDIKGYRMYSIFFLAFSTIAIILNNVFKSNLMFLKKPSTIPVPLLHTLYNNTKWGYTFLVFSVYLFIPYGVTSYLSRAIKKAKLNRQNDCDKEVIKLS